MKVLTAAEMREVDRCTVALGIPGIVLMENAGQRVVEFLDADEQSAEPVDSEALATLSRLNGTLDKLNAGQGTLGQLMVNPALYENLVGTTAETSALMKEFRKNPKKFLTIQLKLF